MLMLSCNKKVNLQVEQQVGSSGGGRSRVGGGRGHIHGGVGGGGQWRPVLQSIEEIGT